MSNCIVSLCIPTNGILEWVGPVVKSIYKQDVDLEKFEVIITDNGNNELFKEEMQQYEKKYSNFVYRKTDAYQFLNQIEAFRLAKGELIKFVNHRMLVKDGAVQYLIDLAEKYVNEKPGIFFSNGNLKFKDEHVECKTFDEYVRKLSYWSSWSGGLACWKSDFSKIPLETKYNELFPHTDILFFEKNKQKYIVDNKEILEEIPVGHGAKGKYNLFYAFSVEYLLVISRLLESKDIGIGTFLKIKADNKRFLEDLYWQFIIRRKECSYNLEHYRDYLNCYYKHVNIRWGAYKSGVMHLIRR